MLILNPASVIFDSQLFPSVSSIAIDRSTSRRVIDWSDQGPHPVFVDCPEQRTSISVVQELAQGDLSAPRPGTFSTLTFSTAHNRSAAGWSEVRIPAVLLAVSHESKSRGFVRTLTFVAVSSDGAADPVTLTPLN